LLPIRNWRARSSCEEPLRQEYCSRSNRTRLPRRNTASAM
jgi:hypothetical protein